jgi:hypothetical protein
MICFTLLMKQEECVAFGRVKITPSGFIFMVTLQEQGCRKPSGTAG